MRICFLTHYYPPEPGAPPARIAALAAGLAGRGHTVTVHTGFPHYPDGPIACGYRNSVLRRERSGGARTIRSFVAPLPNRGVASRLVDHAVFAGGALVTLPASGPQDIVVAESPPLLLGGAAVAYAAAKRAPLVVNVADLWPASAVTLGVLRAESYATRVAERLEGFAYRRAAAVTTPTAGLADMLARHSGVGARVHHLPPVVDLARVPSAPVSPGTGPLRVLYAGNVGLAQGLSTLVEAARLAGPEVVRVMIAGSGAQAAEVAVAANGAPVDLVGVVTPARIRSLLTEAEAVAVLLRGLPLFEAALPTKLVEAMAAGRPVLLAARGEAAAHARAAGQTVVEPDDPAALAAAFAALRARRAELPALGERARAYARTHFEPTRSIDLWDELLLAVVSSKSGASGRPRR